MEVSCERCRARYEFGDDKVGWAGLTVRCSKCGHVFMVRSKGLTVAMPGELPEAPVSAADIDRAPAAPGEAAAARTSAWNLRSARGGVYPFKDLATLQRWIVERKAARDDEVSHQGEPWRRLGDMPELEPFFSVVERAHRASAASSPARPEQSPAGGSAEAKGPVEPRSIELPVPLPQPPEPGPAAGEAGPRTGLDPVRPSEPDLPSVAADPRTDIDPVPQPRPSEPNLPASEADARAGLGPVSQPRPSEPDLPASEADARAGLGPVPQPRPSEPDLPAPVKSEGPFRPPPAPLREELRARPRPIAREGPAMPDRFGSVGAPEPAWTADHSPRPAARQAKRASAPPRRHRGAKGLRLVPIALLGAMAAAALTVYLRKPAWFGFKSVSPPPVQSPVPPPTSAADVPKAPETSGKPAEHGQAGPGPATSAREPVSPARPSPRNARETGPTPDPTLPVPAPPSSSDPNANANEPPSPAPSPPHEARETGPSTPDSTLPVPTPPLTPGPIANENFVEPLSPAPSPPREAKETAPSTPNPTIPAPTPPSSSDPNSDPNANEPREPVPAAKPAEQKPRSLQRLLADARRLRERGKPDAALGTYGRAIELEPENADALAGRGLCYLDLSRYAPAEASFQAALEADEQHAGALMGLAETFRYEGRRTEAVTYYRRYLAAHPEGEDAVAARNAIDALKE